MRFAKQSSVGLVIAFSGLCSELTACSEARSPAPEDLQVDGAASIGSDAGATINSSDRADILARAAVMLGSCWPDDGVNRNLNNLWHAPDIPQFWGRVVQSADCLARARTGCRALTECTGYTTVLGASDCVDGCQGDVFTECYTSAHVSIDCHKLGLHCDPLAVCTPSPAAACDENTFVPSCAADAQPLTCSRDFVQHGPDCAALGLACSKGVCQGSGPACRAPAPGGQYSVEYPATGCAGDILQACVGGGQHPFDCTKLGPGFSCRDVAGSFFCGLAAECVPGNHPTYDDQDGTGLGCSGTTLIFCNAGRLDHVDCRDLGFTGCDDKAKQCTPGFLEPPAVSQ
jgi:hypothetical protein